jgi:two-component system cell cycle sensor histidine kinase/response regulator CckA
MKPPIPANEAARLAIELQETRQALQQSEEKYSRIMHSCPDSIALRTLPEGRYLEVSDSFCRLTGYSREEAIGKTPAELSLKVDPDRGREVLSKAQEHGGVRDEEVRYRTKAGEIRFGLQSATCIAIGGESCLLAITRDITDRKLAEEALRESEKKYARMFHSSPDSITLRTLPDRRYLDVNEGFTRMTGYTREEAIGKTSAELNLWVEEERHQLILETLQKEGEVWEQEFRYRTKSGEVRVAHVNAGRINLRGRPCMLSFTRDTTERKRAEQLLAESELRYRLLFERNLAGVYRTTLDGKILDCNEAGVRMFGYSSKEEILSIHAEDFYFDLADRDRFLRDVQSRRALAGYERRLRKKDGTPIWLLENTSLIEDASGGPAIIQGTIMDITERKRAEGEREVISEIIQGVSETRNLDQLLHLIHGSLKKILYAENCFIALYDSSTCLFTFPFFVDKYDVPPPPVKAERSCMAYVFRTGRPQLIPDDVAERLAASGEIEMVGTNSPSWLGVPLKSPTETIGVLVVQHYERRNAYTDRDIEFLTSVGGQIALAIERKRGEEALRRSEQQLRIAQKMEAIGRLAGGVAHDFNNLLMIILGSVEVLREQLGSGNPLRKSIDAVHQAAERAAGLTRQLLAFSRAQVLQPKVLDLGRIVNEMGKMLPRLIGEDVELTISTDPGMGRIRSDENQLEQILLNLAVNARDAMPRGGKLTVEARDVHIDENFARLHPGASPGDFVLLSVTDNGEGMDEETQARIFEPFFTTKQQGRGTGLGLSTVYGIVQQNNGWISVSSAPGRGSSFKIYFPRVEAPALIAPLKPAPALGGSETILVAEDQEGLRELICDYLGSRGYQVLSAADGTAALDLAARHNGEIHLVLTDVIMPRLGGRELGERLSALRPHARILYMSGYAEYTGSQKSPFRSDAVLLQKPFALETLARKIRELIDLQPR